MLNVITSVSAVDGSTLKNTKLYQYNHFKPSYRQYLVTVLTKLMTSGPVNETSIKQQQVICQKPVVQTESQHVSVTFSLYFIVA